MKFNNNASISSEAEIGKNVRIGDGTIIYTNVSIGDNTIISNNCVIGEPLNEYYNNKEYTNPQTFIGANSLIRSHTIIYAGSSFGDSLQTGHRVTIREKTQAGNHCSFGTNTDIQGDCFIGDYCRFHSYVNIGQKSRIEDYVFIYPFVVLTNDTTPPSDNLIGVEIGKFSQIAASSTIIAGKKIGQHTLIGAASLVHIDVPDFSFASGNPLKVIGDIRKMPFFNNGKKHYPWPYNFDRGMPWENIGFEAWRNKNGTS